MTTSLLPDGPRERAQRDGVSSLSDADLLAMLLGTGSPGCDVYELSRRVLLSASNLSRLGAQGIRGLSKCHGLGVAKAARVVAAFELGRRAVAGNEPTVELSGAGEVHRWARGRIACLDHEELWALLVDGRLRLREARRVAQGGLHGVCVLPRDILRVVLREGASSFILVHNHPSGDPMPSPEDLAFTKAMVVAAHSVGIPLLDHVVVTSTQARSVLAHLEDVSP